MNNLSTEQTSLKPKEPLREILTQKYYYTRILFKNLSTLYKLVYADYFSKHFLNRTVFKGSIGETLAAIILSILTLTITIWPNLKILEQDIATLLAGVSIILATSINIFALYMIFNIYLDGIKDFKIIIKDPEEVKEIEIGGERLKYIRERSRNRLLSLLIINTIVLTLSVPFLIDPQKVWPPIQPIAHLIKETIFYKTHAYKILASTINILYTIIILPSAISLAIAYSRKEDFENYLKIYLAELLLAKIYITKKLGEKIEPEIYAQQNLERWLINMHLKTQTTQQQGRTQQTRQTLTTPSNKTPETRQQS